MGSNSTSTAAAAGGGAIGTEGDPFLFKLLDCCDWGEGDVLGKESKESKIGEEEEGIMGGSGGEEIAILSMPSLVLFSCPVLL